MDKSKLERIKQICFEEKKPQGGPPAATAKETSANRLAALSQGKSLPPQGADPGRSKQHRGAAGRDADRHHTGKLEVRRSKLSEDSEIERMRARSKSRDLKFQEKLQRDQNKSVINRQPASVLKKMGAYRSIGRSQNQDSFFSPDTGNKTLQPSVRHNRDGSLSRGSQEMDQSLFLRFQNKSRDLDPSSAYDQSNVLTPRVGTASKQLNHTAIGRTNMESRMKQIQLNASRSRSASKSKSANRPRRGQNQGTQLKIRQMEDQISNRIRSKQAKLQSNLDAMKERMKERGKAQESQILNDMSHLDQTRIEHVSDEVDNSNFMLFSRPSKPLSPFADAIANGMRNAFTPEKNNMDASANDMSRASPSPPSFRRQKQQTQSLNPLHRLSLQQQPQSYPSQIFGPANQSMSIGNMTTQVDQQQFDPRYSAMGPPFQTIGHNMNTYASFDQAAMPIAEEAPSNLQNCRSFIEFILNMVQSTQKELGLSQNQYGQQNDVEILEHKVIQELKLKLSGAFERLESVQDDFNSQQQILSILQNFLNDIFMKIQKSMSIQDQDSVIRNRIARKILHSLLQQISQLTFSASLPHIASTIQSLRMHIAVQMLSQMQGRHQMMQEACFFRSIGEITISQRQNQYQFENRLSKFHHIFSKLTARKAFHSWRFDYLNMFRLQKLRIHKQVLDYNRQLTKLAASVFNKEFKGLAHFAKKSEQMLGSLLAQHNLNPAYLDILLVNKSQKMVCTFVEVEGEIRRYEYDVANQESLLQASLGSRGGRAQQYVNPFYDQKFNQEVDVPLGLPDRHDFIPRTFDSEYSQSQGDFDWVYFLFPIVERDLEKVKMVVRYSYRDEGLPCLEQMARYTIQVLQKEILESFSQFKQIIRDFTDMERKITEDVTKKNEEDRALGAVKFLEKANQELNELHEENKQYKELYDAVKHQNMKPSEISYLLNHLKNEGQEGRNLHMYVDESLMLCTNNDQSVNERLTTGQPGNREAGYLTKRPSHYEGSSSIGFAEELNHAVAGQQRKEKMPWNYGSAGVDKEAISPISMVRDKTLAEQTDQNTDRHHLNAAAQELLNSLGENNDEKLRLTQARQRLSRQLESQASRNKYKKSKSFDDFQGQGREGQQTSTYEQNQTLLSKDTEISKPSGKLYNKRQKSQMKRIYKQLRILKVKQENAEKLLKALGKYGDKVQDNLRDKVYQDWVKKFQSRQQDALEQQNEPTNIYIEDNKSKMARDELLDVRQSPKSPVIEEHPEYKRCNLLCKIFSRKMKIYFDVMAIKSFQNYIRGYRILRQGNQIAQLRNLYAHRILMQRLQRAKRTAFEKYYAHFLYQRKCLKKLSKIIRRTQEATTRSSLGKWRGETSKQQRQYMAKLKSHCLQQQEDTMFSTFAVNLLKETSEVFKPDQGEDKLSKIIHLQPTFSNFRDFLNSSRFIHMMQKINEHLMHSLRSQRYSGKVLEITDIVYNLQIPSLTADSLQMSDEYLQVTFSVIVDPEKTSKHIKTHLNFLQSGKSDQLITIVHQNTSGFFIPFKHFDKSIQKLCITRKVPLVSLPMSTTSPPSLGSSLRPPSSSILSNGCPTGKNLYLARIRNKWTPVAATGRTSKKAWKEERPDDAKLSGTIEIFVANGVTAGYGAPTAERSELSQPGVTSLEEVKFWLRLIEGHADRMGHCFKGVMTEMIERVGIAQRLKKE